MRMMQGAAPGVVIGSRLTQFVLSFSTAGNEWNGMDTVTDMRQVVANTFRARCAPAGNPRTVSENHSIQRLTAGLSSWQCNG